MSKKRKSKPFWIWPGAGPAPTTETSIKNQSFSVLSYLIYIVREAVQNTTDAWNFLFFGKSEKEKEQSPAEIFFDFGEVDKPSESWFSGLSEARKELTKQNIEGYDKKINYKKISFLKIVDKNTGGIQGSIDKRESDWWNFVLNWGKSNKRKAKSSTSGSKGIGRIAFTLSSDCAAVFVLSKRSENETILSGFANLSSTTVKGEYKAPSAIFADKANGDVWKLHDLSKPFLHDFKIQELKGKKDTGTALVIPFPKKELVNDKDKSKKQIVAALIDTYAPLIVRKHLKPTVMGELIADDNIEAWANEVSLYFSEKDKDTAGFIKFLRQTIYLSEINQDLIEINLDEKCDLENYNLSSSDLAIIESNLNQGKEILFKINFKLEKEDKFLDSFIEVSFRKILEDSSGFKPKGIERYFRNGMALIEERKKASDLYHSAVLCREPEMSKFLNIFEDDGHTKLVEGNVQRDQAKSQNYGNHYINALRLYRNSIKNLLKKFEDKADEIDEQSLAPYFQLKTENMISENVGDKSIHAKKTNKPYKWSQQGKGFSIKHQSNVKLPKQITINVSYASVKELESAKYADWDFDFNSPKMKISTSNCNCLKSSNTIILNNLKKDFELNVTGFDNREPEVIIKDS